MVNKLSNDRSRNGGATKLEKNPRGVGSGAVGGGVRANTGAGGGQKSAQSQTTAAGSAPSAPTGFGATYDATADDRRQRLFLPAIGGRPSAKEKAFKPCSRPFAALKHFGNTPKHRGTICWLQALIRFYRNQLCADQDIRECSEKAVCRNPEVKRIHKLLVAAEALGTSPTEEALKKLEKLIDDYLSDWGLAPGVPHNFQTALTNSKVALARKDRFDEATRNILGKKSTLRIRHFVQVGPRDVVGFTCIAVKKQKS